MIPLRLPPFNPVANGTRATLAIPRYDMTLARVTLKFIGANSLTKATISEIVVKVGSRTVWGPLSAAELDKINKYKGIFDQADSLTIDFTERDALSPDAKEVGGYDIPALGGQDMFIEVMNTAGAGTPALYAMGYFTTLQFDPRNPDPRGQLVKKLVKIQIPSNGGTAVTWTPQFKGALVQRIYNFYTGADWGASTDGNIQTVEVKKNGIAVWDRVACKDARFYQQEMKKVPQSKVYVTDFIADNVHSAAMSTADARSLEINYALGAGDTLYAIAEVLDTPGNL
ncbi:major capsid protein P2 [Roseateles violae]|uniref:Major capsid protein P2 n=1 Tax=Roseateles violae TaxID=3058042 RepID=A0ABT8DXH6_9BURK|nr:major capsid protein P2 [Pelomonas sp. PFR6]MDN3921512.1 major capsid protein P2 [Pelomonas sp. PFR6]